MSGTRASPGVGFWVAAGTGWAVVAFGVVGLVGRLGSDRALDVGIWVVGGNLVHDAIVAPLAFAVAATVARVVSRPWRAPLVAGLSASALVLAVAYPALRGFGRKPNNPSLLPLDYPSAIGTVLVVVWATVATWYVVLVVDRRRSRPTIR